MSGYNYMSKVYESVLDRHKDSNTADFTFYFDLAQKLSGNVLEVGCGAGRILLQFAREGVKIDGLDNSNRMVFVLKPDNN
ncbi:MAG: class I SAM-dependent methyltransferase [Candidatus Peribacteraceae bacterium]|nr:class I SAM-dependent methyltransferase [Candidatus Peribacteraceae bacterium]